MGPTISVSSPLAVTSMADGMRRERLVATAASTSSPVVNRWVSREARSGAKRVEMVSTLLRTDCSSAWRVSGRVGVLVRVPPHPWRTYYGWSTVPVWPSAPCAQAAQPAASPIDGGCRGWAVWCVAGQMNVHGVQISNGIGLITQLLLQGLLIHSVVA